MNKAKTLLIENTISKIKKTKEIIEFAYQLSNSIQSGKIKPTNIIPELIIATGKEDFHIKRDWNCYEEVLKDDFAITTKINIISFQIIVLKESYASLFIQDNSLGLGWAKENIDPELFAAQNILKSVRDAFGHFKSTPFESQAWGTWNFNNKNGNRIYPVKMEIKSINVIFDTSDLQGIPFDWGHLGGIVNFIKVLDFLIADLNVKCNLVSSEFLVKKSL